ncbi:hypothetical protein Ccrd_001961 [Cynara cardunculus var. scolymus]|uniref:Transmembrane protein n=1 Tax=Cynara cardunculus var. scolymus TaxID=59895 RepID=A0A103XS96_CYNCS|nr:hypothetical protein Ccrd_001961 [Cynara cardunculus var. scolymus]
MARFKTVLFCFLFTGIFIFRPISARTVHLSIRPELELDQPLSAHAPESLSSEPAESPVGSDRDGSLGETVHSEKHHHSSDRSVAGGGIIIGGLATVTFAAVYCYIRVTRRKEGENR